MALRPSSLGIYIVGFIPEGEKKGRSSTQAFLGNVCQTESTAISSIITCTVAAPAVENYKILLWNQGVQIWKRYSVASRQHLFPSSMRDLGNISRWREVTLCKAVTSPALTAHHNLLLQSYFIKQGCWSRSLSRQPSRPTDIQQQQKVLCVHHYFSCLKNFHWLFLMRKQRWTWVAAPNQNADTSKVVKNYTAV